MYEKLVPRSPVSVHGINSSRGLTDLAALEEEVAALSAATERSAALALDDSLGKLEVAELAPASSLPPSRRNSELRVQIVDSEEGVVRVCVQERGCTTTSFSAMSYNVWRTASRVHLRGPVMVDSGHGKPVPLLDADLALAVEPDTTGPLLSGTARVPLPTFGVFNGVSVGHSVSANVSARFGDELGADRYLGSDGLCLCFDFGEALVVDGPMIGLIMEAGQAGLILNPGRAAFMLDVQVSTLGGLELRGGKLAVAASPVFRLGAEHSAPDGLAGGKLYLEGTFEVKSLALVVAGEAIADFDSSAGSPASEDPALSVTAFGSAEFATAPAGPRSVTLTVQNAKLTGSVRDDDGFVKLSGVSAVGQSLSGADRLVVAGNDAQVEAVLSSRQDERTVRVTGDFRVALPALPGLAEGSLAGGCLLNAEYVVTSSGAVLTGTWDARKRPLAHFDGLLPLRLELGRSLRDWTLLICDPSGGSSLLLRPPSPRPGSSFDSFS